jgi:hypothetical protein
MISDSPYQTGELLLRPLEGAVAGFAGSLVMLAAVSALNPGASGSASVWIEWLGRLYPGAAQSRGLAGLAIHGLLGAVLGILYAASQQRIPRRPLLGIGAFYGLLLWIGGRIVLGWLFSTPVRDVVHSWVWLAGACVFGITLALSAAWADARRPAPAVSAPRD